MIRFGKDVCGNLEVALRREWVETNGLGGFGSSTIAEVLQAAVEDIYGVRFRLA